MRRLIVAFAIIVTFAWSAYIYYRPDGILVVASDPFASSTPIRVVTHVRKVEPNGPILSIGNNNSRWQIRSIGEAIEDIESGRAVYVPWCRKIGWPALVLSEGDSLRTTGDPEKCNNLLQMPSDIDWDALKASPCEDGDFVDKFVCRLNL